MADETHVQRVERIAEQVRLFFCEAMPGVDIARIAALAADMMAAELTGETYAAKHPIARRHD